MFLKVLAAIVSADALDRHAREKQRRAWVAEEERRRVTAARGEFATFKAPPSTWDRWRQSART